MAVAFQVAVAMFVGLFAAAVGVQMTVGMAVLVGVDQIAVAVFVAVDMGMFMGVLQLDRIPDHQNGSEVFDFHRDTPFAEKYQTVIF